MNNGIGCESWREREHSEWSLIDIYYSFFVLYLILPRPTGLSYFAGFFKDLIPVMLLFLFFTYSGVVSLAILRALLFLWFPEKHGDFAVVLGVCGDCFFLPYRNHHCFYFNKNSPGREAEQGKNAGKAHC
jgi:hypothetical protein